MFYLFPQAAAKDFWCERPSHLKDVPVDVWRKISNTSDNCDVAKIDWSQISLADALTVNIFRFIIYIFSENVF